MQIYTLFNKVVALLRSFLANQCKNDCTNKPHKVLASLTKPFVFHFPDCQRHTNHLHESFTKACSDILSTEDGGTHREELIDKKHQ